MVCILFSTSNVPVNGLADFLSESQRETQRRPTNFDLEKSRVMNEDSDGDVLHGTVTELRSALLVDRLYANNLYNFWVEQQRCLDALADTLKSGRKPTDDDLRYEINLWRHVGIVV
jgi:hypothetical protein